jgi:hypothetical protein
MRDFESIVEQRIREAQEQGEFEGLSGAGKPIPGIDRPHDELWWVRQMLDRENISVLPGHLALRKEAEREVARALDAPSEPAARRIVAALNAKIAQHNRTATSGPGSDMAELSVEEILEHRRRSGR